jgi:hypothetical protein
MTTPHHNHEVYDTSTASHVISITMDFTTSSSSLSIWHASSDRTPGPRIVVVHHRDPLQSMLVEQIPYGPRNIGE